MHKNIGRLKEDEFVLALNDKRAGELSHNLKHVLREMFGLYDDNEKVECGLIDKFQKPDFYIKFKGVTKNVSLKTGRATIVAQEDIKSFIMFLREWNLSIESQKTLLYFHFGDGTLNGAGTKRMSYLELMNKMKPKIEKLNEELNDNKEFIKEMITRTMFKGTREENIEADYIYFGDVNYGVVCSKKQIFKHIDRRSFDFIEGPHIGPLKFRPHARYSSSRVITEESRWKVDFWWLNLAADMAYISERYDG